MSLLGRRNFQHQRGAHSRHNSRNESQHVGSGQAVARIRPADGGTSYGYIGQLTTAGINRGNRWIARSECHHADRRDFVASAIRLVKFVEHGYCRGIVEFLCQGHFVSIQGKSCGLRVGHIEPFENAMQEMQDAVLTLFNALQPLPRLLIEEHDWSMS